MKIKAAETASRFETIFFRSCLCQEEITASSFKHFLFSLLKIFRKIELFYLLSGSHENYYVISKLDLISNSVQSYAKDRST